MPTLNKPHSGGVHATYVELSHCTMDMLLHTFEDTFTQILESQQRLSKKFKNGPLGKKIRIFLLRVDET